MSDAGDSSFLKTAADIGQVLSAFATAAAALLAWRSTRAAAQSVSEMRASRIDPLVSFGAVQQFFRWEWNVREGFPAWAGGYSQAQPRSDPVPTFELANFGGGAALAVVVEFTPENVPEQAEVDPLLVQNGIYLLDWEQDIVKISYRADGDDGYFRGGHSISSPRTSRVKFAHCGKDQRISIPLPSSVGVWAFVSQLGSLVEEGDRQDLSPHAAACIRVEIHFERPDGRFSQQHYRITLRPTFGWRDGWENHEFTRLSVSSLIQVERLPDRRRP